jgi:hypothetical protein
VRMIHTLLILLICNYAYAADALASKDEEKSWWEKRHQRSDIYFPHNAHQQVMSESKDVCMACHPFNTNKVTDLKLLEDVQTIYNEPLEVICHSCHMATRTAPLACDVCHTDTQTIRPPDHKGDYTWFHTEAAKIDEKACRVCHIDLNFCTDCHFRRNASKQMLHPLGYRDRHGLDARINPSTCAGCHQYGYCSECHAGSAR